jgi:hypothetical protein
MSDPFTKRSLSLSGPMTDIAPVTPDDALDLPEVALGLYVETGGTLSLITVRGESRSVVVADYSILPVGVRRVHQSGTTAEGIHALLVI